MKKIRILTVIFDSRIRRDEVPAFRGAVIAKVGKENVLFHNHLDDRQYRYRYPLIQYKLIGGRPSIMCLDNGVDEIHKFFENSDWKLLINDQQYDMKIHRLWLNQFTMQVWDRMWNYSITNWIALNQDNYRRFLNLTAEEEKNELLRRTLTANIISMAKGIHWDVDKTIRLEITHIPRVKLLPLKGQKVTAFTTEFRTNVFLPDFIGLGKSVSLGFGIVQHKKLNSRENIDNIDNAESS